MSSFSSYEEFRILYPPPLWKQRSVKLQLLCFLDTTENLTLRVLNEFEKNTLELVSNGLRENYIKLTLYFMNTIIRQFLRYNLR